MHPLVRLMSAAVLCLAAVPAPAFAGFASAGSITPSSGQLTYDTSEGMLAPGAPPGGPPPVANDVTISYADLVYTVTDTGEAVYAGQGCTQVNEHQVQCSGVNVTDVWVRVGGANDVVDVATVPAQTELYGGAGDDVLRGSDVLVPRGFQGAVQVYTRDWLVGGPGADVLEGRAGSDEITLHEIGLSPPSTPDGSDTVAGGSGDDIVFAGGTVERDVVDGGDGVDRISYTARTGALAVDLSAGVGGEAGENDALASIENVDGGYGPDVLVGDGAANQLLGAGAIDQIAGGGGADFMSGGASNDVLAGGEGNDHVVDGQGDDTMSGGPDADVISGGLGYDRLAGDAGDDVIHTEDQGPDDVACGDGNDEAHVDIEKDVVADDCELLRNRGGAVLTTDASGAQTFAGTDGADTRSGGAEDDRLSGAGGADLLCGNGGDDVLDGGAGGDKLFGDSCAAAAASAATATAAATAGNDVLKGGAGRDELVGGKGADRLIGGAGRDKFDAGPGPDRVDAADGVRETVRCGTGRDVAKVDRRDVVRACENVRRR